MRISCCCLLLVANFFVFPGHAHARDCSINCHDTEKKCCGTGERALNCLPCNLGTAWVLKEASLVQAIFTDFSGRRFTFDGSSDESYNLFTEADHQLNTVLANDNQKARRLGIILRGVGIHGPDTRVKLSVSEENQLEVAINGRIFKDEATRLDGVVITRGCPIDDCVNSTTATSVTVKDRFMSLTAWLQATDSGGLSLAFKLALNEQPMSRVHGILGQSLEGDDPIYEPRLAMPSNMQFYGEGQISDYSTTDLFSSDSTFSIFTRKAERRRQKRKRQMLEGNALASMVFAAKAETGVQPQRRFPK